MRSSLQVSDIGRPVENSHQRVLAPALLDRDQAGLLESLLALSAWIPG